MDAGVAGCRMDHFEEIEGVRREDARWKILLIVNAARPVGINESIVRRILGDVELRLPRDQLRRELDYLSGLGLIETGGDSEWFVMITARGVSVVEYSEPAPAGIARPERN